MGHPTVYPTGTTIYKPEKCFNGYTVFQAKEVGACLIDMNGATVQLWKGLHGLPNTLLPGGFVMGATGERPAKYGYQDLRDLVQVDWDGNVVWKFDHYEYIEDPGEEPRWMARQHHDFQRQGCPVGYHVPDMPPKTDSGHTLLLCHKNTRNSEITEKLLLDDTFVEVDWAGNVIWEWVASEHFDSMGFSEEARNTLYRLPNMREAGGGMADWLHINAMSYLGPNRWFDSGDHRFHPDNIIWSSRQTNIVAITDKANGKLVWKIGPYYDRTPEENKLGWIIGQHHAHMIPKGLPGEGNILVFDNGGWAGYGAANPGAPRGFNNAMRDYSRVLEFNPVTLDIAWQFTPAELGLVFPGDCNRFYSPFISSAQRLPNGNTLITEGSDGRILEVTANHEIVWEYISPYWGKQMKMNMIYRAFRVPYQWVPQLDSPKEIPVEPLDVTRFRVPGAAPHGANRVIEMKGVRPYNLINTACVIPKQRI
jgi:hypothetical protein